MGAPSIKEGTPTIRIRKNNTNTNVDKVQGRNYNTVVNIYKGVRAIRYIYIYIYKAQ